MLQTLRLKPNTVVRGGGYLHFAGPGEERKGGRHVLLLFWERRICVVSRVSGFLGLGLGLFG